MSHSLKGATGTWQTCLVRAFTWVLEVQTQPQAGSIPGCQSSPHWLQRNYSKGILAEVQTHSTPFSQVCAQLGHCRSCNHSMIPVKTSQTNPYFQLQSYSWTGPQPEICKAQFCLYLVRSWKVRILLQQQHPHKKMDLPTVGSSSRHINQTAAPGGGNTAEFQVCSFFTACKSYKDLQTLVFHGQVT